MTNISFSYENPLKLRFTDEFFKELPQTPGVYFFLNQKRKPLYIGKADSLKKRLASYRNAKPGQIPEHILEMIELAHFIEWELHPTGDRALIRENELIRSVQPPFNRAGVEPIAYLFIGLSFGRLAKNISQPRDKKIEVDFRLSHWQLDDEEGYLSFGSFKPRGRIKQSYSALLRLIYAATCERDRFLIPAKLARTSPAYLHSSEIPLEWKDPLINFMQGRNAELLQILCHELLQKENLQPHLYAPLQRDLALAKDFYEIGPRQNRKIARKVGIKGHIVPQKEMDQFFVREFNEKIASAN